MTSWFSINNIAITILGYPMSWVELLATLLTMACVWLALKELVLNWPVALLAIFFSFLLFFQNALYADSFLQVYFFVTSIYGWWYWTRDGETEKIVPVTFLSQTARIYWLVGIILSTCLVSYIMIHLHGWLPDFFPKPTAYPIPDSFVMVVSIAGQWLLAKKKLENWICWIAVNCTAIVIYFMKDIKLFSLLYAVLLVLAIMGVISWRKKNQS